MPKKDFDKLKDQLGPPEALKKKVINEKRDLTVGIAAISKGRSARKAVREVKRKRKKDSLILNNQV
ncbi:hypothetical protein GMMP15_110021 [Candidatus Magnetomoraceae bacterium gMMP-15]